MRTGDDQHGGGADERFLRVAEGCPDDQGHDAGNERHVEEQSGRPIGQDLGPGPGCLRLSDQRMIPDSAVRSPTAVTRTRRLPPAATDPATTWSPGSFVTGRDSPVIMDSSTSARPVDDRAVDWDARPRAHEHDVTLLQCRRGARSRRRLHPVRRSAVSGQKLRQCLQRALGLHDGAHLEPVTEAHDGDEGGELPPDIDLEEAERGGP